MTATWLRQGSTWVQLATAERAKRGAFHLGRGVFVGTDAGATYEFGDPASATAQPFGAGCAGSNGTPVLHAEVPPRLGTTLPLQLANVPAAVLGVGALGADSDTWLGVARPLDLTPLGLTGCANPFGAITTNGLRLRLGS